jgi:hypothetical protein
MLAMQKNGTKCAPRAISRHRDGLVRFRRAGRDLAVATVERDKESLLAELAMEGEFRRSS